MRINGAMDGVASFLQPHNPETCFSPAGQNSLTGPASGHPSIGRITASIRISIH